MKKIIAMMVVVLVLVCGDEGKCETERHILKYKTYYNEILLIYNEHDPDFLNEGAILWMETQDLNKEKGERITSNVSFEMDYPIRILETGFAGKGYDNVYYFIIYTEGDNYSKTAMFIFPYEFPFVINEATMYKIDLPGVTNVLKSASYFDKCLFVFQSEDCYLPFGGEGSISLDLIDIEKGEISHLKKFPPDVRVFFEHISNSVYQFPAANVYHIHDVMTLTPYGLGKIYYIRNPDNPPPSDTTLSSGPLVEVTSFFTEYPETSDDLKFYFNQPSRCHAYGCGWPCMDGECNWLSIWHTIRTTELLIESMEIPK